MTLATLPGRAALGMYPFDALRPHYDRLWTAVRARAPWLPEQLVWDDDLHAQWRRPDMVVAQTCGWPLVTELADLVESGRVHVVGAFVPDLGEGDDSTYRSVLVARRTGSLAEFASLRAAVNGFASLSGWVSLLAAVHGPGARWHGDVVVTGAHVDSVRAVAAGQADIASIDALSLAHLRRLDPSLCEGLVELGRGPRVVSLPVIAGAGATPEHLAELRHALADALADPALATTREALLMRGFEARDYADYLPLRALAPAPQ